MRARFVPVPIASTAATSPNDRPAGVRVRRLASVLLGSVLVAASLLAGCTSKGEPDVAPTGLAAESPEQIMAKSKAAMVAAGSYRAKGQVSSGAQKVTMDIHFKGNDSKGTLTFGDIPLELVHIGNDLYVKAPGEVLTSFVPEAAGIDLSLIKDKYLKLDSTNKDYLALAFDPAEVFKAEGALVKGQPSTVNGKPVITVLDGGQNKFFIALDGEPYLLRQEGPGGPVDVTDIGVPVELVAPSVDKVYDLKAFTGK